MSDYITPFEHQEEIAPIVEHILKKYGLVYLAMEERTGKSLIGVIVAENCDIQKVLIVTKKGKPLDGWKDLLKVYPHLKEYYVVNYHSIHKIDFKPDLVILDEPHNYISSYPKPSTTWKKVYKIVYGLPIIYMSATPYAQGTQLIYHQLALSAWSPFIKYQNFYDWYKHYADRDKEGRLRLLYIGGMREAIDYKAIRHDEVIEEIDHLFISKTRLELGFEHEPEDVLHYITLDKNIRDVYNTLLKDKAIKFEHSENGKDYELVCDSQIKLRWALHMLEGGSLKMTDKKNKTVEYIQLGNTEKVDFILDKFGDTDELAIMYQYKSEKDKLEKYFKNALLLQSTTNAEGVDLHHIKDLVIYSQDFSTARHTQRRARQANKNRSEEIKVHFILVKRAVSDQVYKMVSKNKRNFVDSVFEKEEI